MRKYAGTRWHDLNRPQRARSGRSVPEMIVRFWGVMKQEIKEKISKALKAKWASGTRKPTPQEAYAKASESHKRGYVEGRRVAPGMTPEQARERGAKRDKQKMIEINRRIGNEKIGVPNPPGPSAKSADHWKAKYWILKAPNQQIVQGWNLSELIRQYAHLFHPDDIVWEKSMCRASKGIRQLFEMRKDGAGAKMHSWKGWMIGDRRDEEPNAK